MYHIALGNLNLQDVEVSQQYALSTILSYLILAFCYYYNSLSSVGKELVVSFQLT